MMPMSNPLAAMAQLAKTGGDPMQMVRQMAGRDPRMRQFMQMINGKSPLQLRQIAENMAKESGTTVEEIARTLGIY